MTKIIILLNLIAFIINLLALIFSINAVRKGRLYWQSGVFLIITLLITAFVFFANVLEYTGINVVLDSFEEYFELLIIPSMSIFFYSQASEDELRMRRSNERQLESLLEERKDIIHELHHRIRNNIQIIYSLLNLQSANIEKNEIKEELSIASSRIEAVGAANYYLYADKDNGGINIESCFSDIVGNLTTNFMIDRKKFSIDISDTGLTRGIDTVVPCCLILNEIVGNIFSCLEKEPFGSLAINIDNLDANMLELIFRYNGPEISEEQILDGTGIGRKIIDELVTQMNGTYEIQRTDKLKIIFKLNTI